MIAGSLLRDSRLTIYPLFCAIYLLLLKNDINILKNNKFILKFNLKNVIVNSTGAIQRFDGKRGAV